MNTFFIFVTVIIMCFEDVTGLICRQYAARPEPPVEVQQPQIISDEFIKYYREGDVAEIDCESTEHYHQWQHLYRNSTNQESSNDSKILTIGKIPYQEGTVKSNYSITVETFDNNTSMYCKNKKDFTAYVKKLDIQLCNDSTNNNLTKQKLLRYSDNQSILFSCEEYVEAPDKNYTFIGAINTILNTITTVAKSVWESEPMKKTDDGIFILCCIYYEVNVTGDVTKIIRHVDKKTLLIYDGNVQKDTMEGTVMPNAETSGQTITLYIVSVAGGLLLLVVVIVICKKRCRKKVMPENKIIFYADLDVLRNVQPERRFSKSEEEAPYAEIIGVMKPNQ